MRAGRAPLTIRLFFPFLSESAKRGSRSFPPFSLRCFPSSRIDQVRILIPSWLCFSFSTTSMEKAAIRSPSLLFQHADERHGWRFLYPRNVAGKRLFSVQRWRPRDFTPSPPPFLLAERFRACPLSREQMKALPRRSVFFPSM